MAKNIYFAYNLASRIMKEKREGFKIYVDPLKHGHVERIDECFTPDFLDVKEKELIFSDPVLVQGEAYAAEANLILHLTASTHAYMFCSMCNERVKVAVNLENLYHAVPLADVKGAVFSMADVIREGILLEIPHFAECNGGKCPKREELNRYLSKEGSSGSQEQTHYRPFEGLDI
jgi:uncharacterized metal-binding protein YceD (DUF177 family)